VCQGGGGALREGKFSTEELGDAPQPSKAEYHGQGTFKGRTVLPEKSKQKKNILKEEKRGSETLGKKAGEEHKEEETALGIAAIDGGS